MSQDPGATPDAPALPQRLVRDLYEHGISPKAMAALGLYPLVHVAWADGRIQAAERELVDRQVIRAGLSEPAQKVVKAWLAHRPKRAQALLDLAWQMVERLPAPLQRIAAQDAGRMARMLALAAGPAPSPVEPSEEVALAEVVAALGGRSAETARRAALLFGLEVEDQIAGYQISAPLEQLPASNATPDADVDAALRFLVRPGPRFRRYTWRPQSGQRRLFELLTRAHRQAADAVAEFGIGSRLTDLDAWQVCRLVIWLVCRGATYDPAYRRALGEGEAGAPEEDGQADAAPRVTRDLPTRDHLSSLELLRGVLDAADIPLICRDYVRLTVELFEACRVHLASCRRARLVPVMGNHDLRSASGHAWCLFLDAESRVAVALDPTSADGLWDAGYASGPFNDLLDARGLCTASVTLTRLIEEPSLAAGRAVAAMVLGLPAGLRPKLLVRTLGQSMTELDLDLTELRLMLQAAQVAGAPSGFVDGILQRRSAFGALGGSHAADADEPLRRGRLVTWMGKVGLLTAADLPRRLAADLASYRSWESARTAKRSGVGRNDPCPCGSGLKYKRCCGRRAR